MDPSQCHTSLLIEAKLELNLASDPAMGSAGGCRQGAGSQLECNCWRALQAAVGSCLPCAGSMLVAGVGWVSYPLFPSSIWVSFLADLKGADWSESYSIVFMAMEIITREGWNLLKLGTNSILTMWEQNAASVWATWYSRIDSDRSDWRTGAPLLWGQAERVELVLPGEGSGETLWPFNT